jgi:GTP cyclohydrolase II
MNHVPISDEVPGIVQMHTGIGDVDRPANAPAPNQRAVHHAITELRRGRPVLLRSHPELVLLPAETAGAQGLQAFLALAQGTAMLVLAPARAAAVLRRPLAPPTDSCTLALSPALLNPEVLRGLADPTALQLLPEQPSLRPDAPDGAAAALTLAKLARLLPAVVVAQAGARAIDESRTLSLLSVTPQDVLDYPLAVAISLARVAEARVPLDGAPDARIIAFRAVDTSIEHLAILVGYPEASVAPLVRIHSECFTGDLLGSLRCDCGSQLRGAISRMAEDGAGVLLYLAQEGRGIGLVNKLRAYALQDRGMDTLDANRALGWGADERNFLVAATMLEELGIGEIRLLTNNPDKVGALRACGIAVQREPHAFASNGVNDRYLATKAERFGHLLG